MTNEEEDDQAERLINEGMFCKVHFRDRHLLWRIR